MMWINFRNIIYIIYLVGWAKLQIVVKSVPPGAGGGGGLEICQVCMVESKSRIKTWFRGNVRWFFAVGEKPGRFVRSWVMRVLWWRRRWDNALQCMGDSEDLRDYEIVSYAGLEVKTKMRRCFAVHEGLRRFARLWDCKLCRLGGQDEDETVLWSAWKTRKICEIARL